MSNTLTLDQLDQYGTLDSLPFSLDNNWTDEGVCGPFTLEGLDQFNTNLDELQFSLDSEVWNTACIKLERGLSFTGTGSLNVVLPEFITAEAAFTGTGTVVAGAFVTRDVQGLISGTGTLTSASTRIRTVDGAIAGDGSLSADGTRERLVAAAISGNANVTADSLRIRTVAGSILGQGTLTATVGKQETFFVDAQFTGEGTLTATAIIAEPVQVSANITGTADLDAYISVTYGDNVVAFTGTGTLDVSFGNVFDIQATMRGNLTVVASSYIYGQEWAVVPDEANTWTELSSDTNTWTEIEAESNTWRLRA